MVELGLIPGTVINCGRVLGEMGLVLLEELAGESRIKGKERGSQSYATPRVGRKARREQGRDLDSGRRVVH